jgi:hypothetical protein
VIHTINTHSPDELGNALRKNEQHFLSNQKNPVFERLDEIIAESVHVSVNHDKVKELALRYSKEDLMLPKWDAPVFLDGDSKQVADFMILGNTINFAYTDFSTKQDYEFPYKGISFKGAFGMWASLKAAFEAGKPILDGDYLMGLTLSDAKEIFKGTAPMPMLQERVKILNDVGEVLDGEYREHFHNFLAACDGRIFNSGKGFVEMLVKKFPSFDDRANYHGKEVVFNKRAQLAAFMLYEKFRGMQKAIFPSEDVKMLSVAADYELPKVLNAVGVLQYKDDLEKRINNSELIPARSDEEIEIRASTIYAAKQLVDGINELRGSQNSVNALHIDYRLWKEGEGRTDVKHHLTVTTAY